MALGLFLNALSTTGQSAPAVKATGSVEGHVTCDDGAVPGRAADVRLVPLSSLLSRDDGAKASGPKAVEVPADFSGYYIFPEVAPGTYLVDARKDGYSADLNLVKQVLGRFSPDDQKKLLGTFPQVTVIPGIALQSDVIIHSAGAISGHVTVDGGGTPGKVSVFATMVSSKLIGSVEGSSDQKPVDYTQSAILDDRGIYRIAGLPSGSYRVGVRSTEGFYQVHIGEGGHLDLKPTRTGVASFTVFAPEALTKDSARRVSIGDGDELSDADINIPTRLLHAIGGTVTQGGVPLADASLSIQRQGSEPQDYGAISGDDGGYRFDLLPAGSYIVTVKYPNPAQSKISGAITPTAKPVAKTTTVQLGEADVTDANVEISSPHER